jgi:hypothetical protein
MDIVGAKALKERLGENGGEANPPGSVDVSEHAPPVYRYLGVSETPSAAPPADADDEPPVGRRPVLLRLLTLSFR